MRQCLASEGFAIENEYGGYHREPMGGEYVQCGRFGQKGMSAYDAATKWLPNTRQKYYIMIANNTIDKTSML